MNLSIVIPVFNRENTIGYCLDSILGQRNPLPYEIIVVNDGSTDRSLAVIEDRLARSSVPVSLINQQNAGVSAARNTGKSLAKGDYIWFVDSDDVLPQGALRFLGLALTACPVDILHFKAKRMDAVPSEFVVKDCLPDSARPDSVLSLTRVDDAPEIARLPLIGWNALYRRTLIESIHFQPFKQGEDYLFGTEAVVNAREIAVFDVILYGYIYGHPSASIVRDDEAFLTIVEVMKRRLMVVEAAQVSMGVKRAFCRKLGTELVQRITTNFERSRVSRRGWICFFKTQCRMTVQSPCSTRLQKIIGFFIWLPHSSHVVYFVYHCFRVRGWVAAKCKRLLAGRAYTKRQVHRVEDGAR